MRNVVMYAFRLTIGKMIEMSFLDNYKRVVIKIGSSTLTHAETGSLNFSKMERLVRSICDYRNSGMDVCLVSSGAIAVGRDVIGIKERPSDISIKLLKCIHNIASGNRIDYGIFCHEHLSGILIILGKKLLICHHKPALSHCGACLLY